jgi:polyhydroxyalkanoate synthase subunit PhaC
LRNTYLENNLVKPGKAKVVGQTIDFSQLTMPAYVMGAREDHIVPWESAWRSAQFLGGPVRYVLGASGHIAGSINPASKNKRSYWVNEGVNEGANEGRSADTPQAWLENATEMPGSWWNDWAQWLKPLSGGPVPARAPERNTRYRPIEPAPGRYVKVRNQV